MISCSYILVYIISVLFLKESYSLTKLLANLLIVSGVVLLYIGKKIETKFFGGREKGAWEE
jgi:uncharacterized membrane protein